MAIQFRNQQEEMLLAEVQYLHTSAPLLVFVHGICGNKDEGKYLFKEAKDFFLMKGMNTFRFDMSGVGESKGDYLDSTLEKQTSDVNSALEFIADIVKPRCIGLIGFSLGATAAILANNPSVGAYSFWSPAFFPEKDMFPRYDTPGVRRQLEEKGYIVKKGLKVSKKLIEDLRDRDLGSALPKLSKPVQIIHGTHDKYIDHRSSIKASKSLLFLSELQLIGGADHVFMDELRYRKEVFNYTHFWFARKFDCGRIEG
ncbi:MAG: hypothetical protein KAT43_05040 [Nanoarchaeota archaeon]|nr:hypothetical protein [Nanoarchaeota archaeon]